MKGEGMSSGVKTIVGILIVLVLVGGFASTVFSGMNSTSLCGASYTNNSICVTSAPSWTLIVFPIVAGIAILLIILKVTGIW